MKTFTNAESLTRAERGALSSYLNADFNNRFEASEDAYFVWATDKCLSGWGQAEGRIHKQVAACASRAEARRLVDWFNSDTSYKNVNYGPASCGLPRWDARRVSYTVRPSESFRKLY